AVVVRLHAVASDDGITVMAGGNGRVLADGDDPRRPTARLAKDVWVLGADRVTPVLVAPPLPQVDLGASVPTRAADALFTVGRVAERAEAIARTARVVAARRLEDPLLVVLDGGRWAARTAAALRTVTRAGGDPDGAATAPLALVDAELRAAATAVVDNVATLIAEATSVGEYLSVTTGRVLRSLGQVTEGWAPIDVLDATIVDLAAFAGLWNESTVRGPAWRFGDIGRRVERALVVLGLIETCVGPMDPSDVIDTSVLEVVLAANESLVAYRRRHRSDVELEPAVELLLHDRDNPRSYAASLDRLAAHVAAIGWADGEIAVRAMTAMLAGDHPLDRVAAARAEVTAFAELVEATWFATPVRPMLVQGIV
ncbi:MAG TPA: alpha-E domain-containing protein, partial [Ilumatobacteraceae bacterium]|nr:alpha-E domain-containing protein [Ilumatobacteraceae bacterium]